LAQKQTLSLKLLILLGKLNSGGFYGVGYYYAVGGYGSSVDNKFTLLMASDVNRVRNTYLLQHYEAGATEIEVANANNWRVGDELLLAPYWDSVDSINYSNFDYETVTITSINETTIGITETIYPHGYDLDEDIEAGAVTNKILRVVIEGLDDSK